MKVEAFEPKPPETKLLFVIVESVFLIRALHAVVNVPLNRRRYKRSRSETTFLLLKIHSRQAKFREKTKCSDREEPQTDCKHFDPCSLTPSMGVAFRNGRGY